MQNTKLLLTSLTLVGLLALAGCSFPGLQNRHPAGQCRYAGHDRPIAPRNDPPPSKVIMGNPLIQDTFNTNRWDYLYSLQPGGGQRQQERMSIFFNDSDQLVSLSGDFMPGVSRDQESSAAAATPPSAQPLNRPSQANRKKNRPSQARWKNRSRRIDTIETTPVPTPAPLEPPRNKRGETKKPGQCPGFLLPARLKDHCVPNKHQAYPCRAALALAARSLRTSFGSANNGR